MGKVTPQYLLTGAVLALEQCGLLLRDANHLYRLGSYATAIAVAAHAHEEIGRYKILLELWRRTLAGEAFTVKDIQKTCSKHVKKQREGLLAITFTDDGGRGSKLGKLIRAHMEAPMQSPERQKLETELDHTIAELKKSLPSDRHKMRMLGLYVQPKSETEWHRPADFTAPAAFAFLLSAGNDYSLQHHPYTTLSNLAHDPQFHKALEQWPERPTLVPAEWPTLPQGGQWPVLAGRIAVNIAKLPELLGGR
jgi:AbiV family abortive infection protein